MDDAAGGEFGKAHDGKPSTRFKALYLFTKEKYAMGTPAAPPPSRFNFAAHLLARNAGRAAKTAYIDDQQALSYGELAQRVERMAAALAGLGIRREERVLVCLHDTVDFPVVFLGALHAGVIPVAVNTLLTADDYAYMLEHSRARAIVVSGALAAGAAAGDGARVRTTSRRSSYRGRLGALPAGAHEFWRHCSPRHAGACAAARARPTPTTWRSGSTPPDRPAVRRAPCTRTPTCTGPPRPTAGRCSGCATTTSCSPRRSFSSRTAWAMR